MDRRDFVKRAAGAGAGLLILPSGTLFGQNPPSNRLNIALVGAYGRGSQHYSVLAAQNVVALCDVNENRLTEAVRVFPGAKTHVDWRRMLDQKDIEAVMICVPDHHHAFIANWAMNRGKHVYCEKPLGISVDEVRVVRANYLKNRAKLATQHGTQRHAFPNFERVRELVLDGAIGELRTIHGWDSRQLPRPSYPRGEGEPPAYFNYDQWIGPSPYHPYSPQYFARPGAGNNCLAWNEYRDFGVGQMGDMGAHTMDLLWNAIDAGAPTAVEVDMSVSDTYNPDVNPVKLKVTFEHPKNSWRGPVTVVWYQGGLKPPSPRPSIDITRIGNGALFEGTKGAILADFNSRMILPSNDDGDMTYYRRRSADQRLRLLGGALELPASQTAFGGGGRGGAAAGAGGRGGAAGAPAARGGAAGAPAGAPGAAGGRASAAGGRGGGGGGEEFGPDGFPIVQLLENKVPPSMGAPNPYTAPVQPTISAFQQEWFDACRGLHNNKVYGTSTKTHVDFDYAGTMMEQMLLGLVAHRAGKKLQYDAATGRVTNMPEANDWLKRTYRPGWTLNG